MEPTTETNKAPQAAPQEVMPPPACEEDQTKSEPVEVKPTPIDPPYEIPKSVNELQKLKKMEFTNWELEAVITSLNKPNSRNNIKHIRTLSH